VLCLDSKELHFRVEWFFVHYLYHEVSRSVIRITGWSGPPLPHFHRMTEWLLCLSLLSYGQPDDNHVWSKHVAAPWTEYKIFFLILTGFILYLWLSKNTQWLNCQQLFENVNPVTNQINPRWRSCTLEVAVSWLVGCLFACSMLTACQKLKTSCLFPASPTPAV